MPAELDNWAAQLRAGDTRALSRAITAVENRDPAAEQLLERVFAHTGSAYLIGVTGPPGAGKSTLVDRLAAHYRAQGRSVGILAVDPTSPYTGGAILGDRIRMQAHFGDTGVYIRSMATRGFLGGLAAATAEAALLLDAAGKQIVLIETVGAGQDEVDVVRLADCTLLVLVPGLGDDVQGMKAGLMEAADIFVLNKSDREGADRLEQQIQSVLDLMPPGESACRPAIVRTVASGNRGIAELAAAIDAFRARPQAEAARQAKRRDFWKRRLVSLLGEQLLERALRRSEVRSGDRAGGEGEAQLDALAAEIADRRKSPYAAAREWMDAALQ